jgi:2-dehydro-3-deoxy-L-rhamnonate dehydrogenase (NAD+)
MIEMTLSHRTAIITGSTKGIGLAIARRLAFAGCSVAVVGRNIIAADQTAMQLRDEGCSAASFCCDVSDATSVRELVKAVLKTFGRIDILVNNAGLIGKTIPIQEITDSEWHRTIDVNLSGTFYCCREVIQHMIQNKSGKIVNIASMSAKDGNALQTSYSAAKAGVVALTKALGKEVSRYNIFVNAITPAAIHTDGLKDMDPAFIKRITEAIPMGRLGLPEEVAAMVHWLCSDEISFTTGAVFDLSGGRATY